MTPGLPEGYDARAEAQRLLRTTRAGALATLSADGFPFATLVNVAPAMDGSPILLLSGLSAHTQNLEHEPRTSVLLAATGKGDPLAHPRLTVAGTARRVDDLAGREILKNRFLARHPKSALYADFGDFSFWRMDVERGHLNGGFARAAEFTAKALLTSLDEANELQAIEGDALEHVNADHGAAIELYATILLGQKKGRWRATGIDPEGLDIALGDTALRLTFPERVVDGAGLRTMLAQLAARARKESGP